MPPKTKQREKRFGMFVCRKCHKSFDRQDHLDRHEETHEKTVNPCTVCDKFYIDRGQLERHWRKKCGALDSVARDRSTMSFDQLKELVRRYVEQRGTILEEGPPTNQVDKTADQGPSSAAP